MRIRVRLFNDDMDVHARIRNFLQDQTIVSLGDDKPALPQDGFIKAGIVPFIRRDGNWYFYLMKPVAKHLALGAPKFQICKGTRMRCLSNTSWQDMREGEPMQGTMESLAATAVREGIEELGLIPENMGAILDVGPYDFASAVTGKGKRMWLFAAEMVLDQFLLPHDVAETTAERGWLSFAQFEIVGREDHRYILQDIEKKLVAYYLLLRSKFYPTDRA